MELSKELNYPKAEAVLILNIGIIYSHMGDNSKAIENITAAISQLELYHMDHHLSTAYTTLGNIFYDLADYVTAFSYYSKATYIAKKHCFHDRLSVAYNNIGEIYKVMVNYSKASEYYQKSLEEDKDLDFKRRGVILINLAEIYYFNADYDQALELVSTGQSLSRKAIVNFLFVKVIE